eukprot:NODE_288_length_1527_cov_31.529770_g209_i0.p2 GENE.NODE_288_length_1527_cov_31.529770_g209_i0~~NODE_288_length_1527_cov_31.529770_g209_i0.p2  ORF type:complete len:51 (-),score=0.13 NODE_288_length_1527_cov_31.529770_g209_i0:516-668(-)
MNGENDNKKKQENRENDKPKRKQGSSTFATVNKHRSKNGHRMIKKNSDED